MSLILEALKKLERERQSSDRGFLVLGPGAWPGPSGSRRRTAAALAGAALLGGVAGTALWRVREARPPAAAAAGVAAAVPSLAPLESPRLAAPDTAPTPRLPYPQAGAERLEPRVAPERASAPEPLEADQPAPPTSAAPPEREPRFRLQAISSRDGRPVAVLSDRLVYEGDSFDGVKVLRIGDAEVEIEVDGRRLVVRF